VYGDGPPPDGYVLEKKVNTGVIVGGLVTFGAMYGISIAYGASQNFEQGMGAVAVPLLGPWLALAQRNFSCPFDPSAAGAEACQQKTVDEAATLAVLSGLGIGQMVGATLTMIGVLDSKALWVRADAVGARFTVDSLGVVGGSGLQVRGVF